MSEHELSGPEFIRNPEVTFESRDLSARIVLGFLIALAIAGVIVIVLLWGVYKYLGSSEVASHPVSSPIVTSKEVLKEVGGDPALKFPQPRLQPDPVGDLNKFRAREEELLNSYGWIDKNAGKVHIPIERAIDMVAQTGLPTRPRAKPLESPPGNGESDGGINVPPDAGKLPSGSY